MIEAVGLTKRYGRTLAVDALSFVARPGRVTGLLGPNGAGKSTTMRMMLGLDEPTKGAVLIDGKRYRKMTHPLRTVGASLDPRWAHPNRSARAHLRWLAESNRLGSARVHEVLDLVGLSAVAGKRVGTFSLGMSQRLGIAAALLGDPGVVVLDEPVNGLDPEGIQWIRELMRRLAAEGRTVFVSSHLLSEMIDTADDLVVIGRGSLIAQCTMTEFVDRVAASAIRVRSPQVDRLGTLLRGHGISVTSALYDDALIVTGASTDRIGELAAADGVVLHELADQRDSLEEAFMRLTGGTVEYHEGPAASTDALVPAGK